MSWYFHAVPRRDEVFQSLLRAIREQRYLLDFQCFDGKLISGTRPSLHLKFHRDLKCRFLVLRQSCYVRVSRFLLVAC